MKGIILLAEATSNWYCFYTIAGEKTAQQVNIALGVIVLLLIIFIPIIRRYKSQ